MDTVIENRGGIHCVVDGVGGVRPAGAFELELWNRLQQKRQAPAVPEGWTIQKQGDELSILAPASGPGAIRFEIGSGGSLEQRILEALALALLEPSAGDASNA